jgi:hypothetical protein
MMRFVVFIISFCYYDVYGMPGLTLRMVWNGITIDKYDGRSLVENVPNWSAMKSIQTDEGALFLLFYSI